MERLRSNLAIFLYIIDVFTGKEVTTESSTKPEGCEVLCGPINMANTVDLSGQSGVVTLSSPQIITTKARSFLIQLKPVILESEKVICEQSCLLSIMVFYI